MGVFMTGINRPQRFSRALMFLRFSLFWCCSGVVLMLFSVILVLLLYWSGVIVGLFSGCSGVVLVLFRIVLVMFLGYTGVVLGLSWYYSGDVLA